MNKLITAIALVAVLALPVAANADECKNFSFADQEKVLKEINAATGKLSGEQVKVLIEKLGNPPGVEEGPFDIYRADVGEASALFVVQKGCVVTAVGPTNRERIDAMLGVTRAGERVD